MNWRKGFFRIWLLIFVASALAGTATYIANRQKCRAVTKEDLDEGRRTDDESAQQISRSAAFWDIPENSKKLELMRKNESKDGYFAYDAMLKMEIAAGVWHSDSGTKRSTSEIVLARRNCLNSAFQDSWISDGLKISMLSGIGFLAALWIGSGFNTRKVSS